MQGFTSRSSPATDVSAGTVRAASLRLLEQRQQIQTSDEVLAHSHMLWRQAAATATRSTPLQSLPDVPNIQRLAAEDLSLMEWVWTGGDSRVAVGVKQLAGIRVAGQPPRDGVCPPALR